MSTLSCAPLDSKKVHSRLGSMKSDELYSKRILWTGAVVHEEEDKVDERKSCTPSAVLFHDLRAERRAQAYSNDLLFNPKEQQLVNVECFDASEEYKEEDHTLFAFSQYHNQLSSDELEREWLSQICSHAAGVFCLELRQILKSGLDEIDSDLSVNQIDFLDRKILWVAEKALGKLAESYAEAKNSALQLRILQDASHIINILVLLEKIWFTLRGAAIPVVLLNTSQQALRFQVVLFQFETLGKLRLLLSEALAIAPEHLHIEFSRGGRSSVTIDDDSITLVQFLESLEPAQVHPVLSFKFNTIAQKQVLFQTDHFMEKPHVRQLKTKVVEILEEIFHTHAPPPALQEANEILFCLASRFSNPDSCVVRKLTANKQFDKNLIGLIFKFSHQRSAMNLDRLTQHILSCGISPMSTSASENRVLNLLRTYGHELIKDHPETSEMDLDGFIRFYTDAFLERPMLSWYDYLAYGYSHEFEQDRRIVPLFLSLQDVSRSSRNQYEYYRLSDYLLNPDNQRGACDSKVPPECLQTTPGLTKRISVDDSNAYSKERFWATNRVEFTSRGVVERPGVRLLLAEICNHPDIPTELSLTASNVLRWREENIKVQGSRYSSGKVAPIAALYL